MATEKQEMELLLSLVSDYALNWKLRFNVEKCFNLTIRPPENKNKSITKLYLNDKQLTQKISTT